VSAELAHKRSGGAELHWVSVSQVGTVQILISIAGQARCGTNDREKIRILVKKRHCVLLFPQPSADSVTTQLSKMKFVGKQWEVGMKIDDGRLGIS